jgi:hypothetical protein
MFPIRIGGEEMKQNNPKQRFGKRRDGAQEKDKMGNILFRCKKKPITAQ